MTNYSKLTLFLLIFLTFINILHFYWRQQTCLFDFNSANISTHMNRDDVRDIDKNILSGTSRRDLISTYSHYTPAILNAIKRLSRDKVAYDDPDLIDIIRRVMDPPSDGNMIKFAKQLFKTPQAECVDDYLKKMRNGFFVEVGALDGERSSNSIFFEKERGWTGLLIEMDPYFYLQLIGKNRRAFSINACLSPYPYATMMPYKPSSGGSGVIEMDPGALSTKETTIPCFPLASLLLAINVSRVDYFSLDVEGVELAILRTFVPNAGLRVDALSVEYVHGDKRAYAAYMRQYGYAVVKDIHDHRDVMTLYVDDFIFVKNESIVNVFEESEATRV